VKDASIKRRERYENVLSKIELLSAMDPYERTHLCDGLKTLKAKEGEYIIR
jgi:cAMP-dependent protein kinase regulator